MAEDATGRFCAAVSRRIVYVVGKGRSGSTLLDDLLGTVPGVASLGELRLLWSRGFTEGYRCACGELVAECPVWSAAVVDAIGSTSPVALAATDALQDRVLSWSHAPRLLARGPGDDDRELGEIMGRLYSSLADRLGADVLVDSSKWPLPPGAFGVVPGSEAWVLHLVRDPRAVAHSYQRRKGGVGQPELPRFGAVHTSLSWSARNATAELARRPVPAERFRRVRYEDLAADPRGTLGSLGEWLGIPDADGAFVGDRTVRLGEAHLVGGNPRRLDRGDIEITADQEWSVSSATRSQRVVGALTAPLRARYGYTGTG
jgi:hypothetical protein